MLHEIYFLEPFYLEIRIQVLILKLNAFALGCVAYKFYKQCFKLRIDDRYYMFTFYIYLIHKNITCKKMFAGIKCFDVCQR